MGDPGSMEPKPVGRAHAPCPRRKHGKGLVHDLRPAPGRGAIPIEGVELNHHLLIRAKPVFGGEALLIATEPAIPKEVSSFASDTSRPGSEIPNHWGEGATGRDDRGRRYVLLQPLDRGGMGELYMASVEDPERRIERAVIKRLLPELSAEPDFVQMFEEEAKIMSQLNHPSVVKVVGLPVIERNLCMALEFVPGCSVQELVGRAHQLRTLIPPTVVAYIGTQLAKALDHVHRATDAIGHPLCLIHRDVSPGNVLLGLDGSVKLTDFGISKSKLSQVSTAVGIVKGKARYLSPEQVKDQPATRRSDLYSLGLVLVEMLTGEPLYERESIPKTLYSVVHGQRPPVSTLLPPAAAPMAKLLETMIQTKPERRFRSADQVVWELEQLQGRIGPPIRGEDLGAYVRGIIQGAPIEPKPRALSRTATPADHNAFDEIPPTSPFEQDGTFDLFSETGPDSKTITDPDELPNEPAMMAYLKEKAAEFGEEPETKSNFKSYSDRPAAQGFSKPFLLGALAGFALGFGVAAFFLG